MTTEEIIQTINNFIPFGEDDSENDNESFFYQAMEELKNKQDFELAIEPVFKLIEKYPLVEFGSPGPLVHTIESFEKYYEKYLFESLKRRPTPLTIWMLNRIINGEQNMIIKQNLVGRLQSLLDHPSIEKETTQIIKDFISYQTK